jgi:predicted GNAT superfamily acetyltransferase
MMARFGVAKFEDRSLANWATIITGQVCVYKTSRGLGIFERLYEELWQLTPAQYKLAIALVATSNPRSLAAHKKIGMSEVHQFAYNGKTYNTMAMKIGQG